MASSEVDICNMALANIGVKSFIDDLAETTTEADVCSRFYAHCRDKLLAEWDWPFARRRSVLAEMAGESNAYWALVYSLPTDCIADRFIVIPGDPATGATGFTLPPFDVTSVRPANPRAPRAEQRIPYDIELAADGQTKVLVTDQEDAELAYTARVETVGTFDIPFVEALTWLLASKLAMPLSVKAEYAKGAYDMYRAELLKAKQAAARRGQEDVRPSSEFIAGRE